MLQEVPYRTAVCVARAQETRALQIVREFLATDEPTLVLQGGTGSGKTVAAGWGFEYERSRHGRPGVWCHMRDIAALADWKREQWAIFDAAPLIVIDDLGREVSAANAAAVIERVDNLARGRCIYTTNLDVIPAMGLYGERASSRLVQARWLAVACEDMRVTPPTTPLAPPPRFVQEAADEAVPFLSPEYVQNEIDKLYARLRADGKIVTHFPETGGQQDGRDNERRRELRKQAESRRAREK